MPTETLPSAPDTISTTSQWTVDLHYNRSPYDAARTTNQVIRTSSLTRLGEIQHTALGDTTTKRRTWPDHRVTTHDIKSHLHLHPTLVLEEKRTKNFIIITTFFYTIPIINILCFILYSHPRDGRHCHNEERARGNTKDSQWFRIKNVDTSVNIPVHGTRHRPSEEFAEQNFLQDEVRAASSRCATQKISRLWVNANHILL